MTQNTLLTLPKFIFKGYDITLTSSATICHMIQHFKMILSVKIFKYVTHFHLNNDFHLSALTAF